MTPADSADYSGRFGSLRFGLEIFVLIAVVGVDLALELPGMADTSPTMMAAAFKLAFSSLPHYPHPSPVWRAASIGKWRLLRYYTGSIIFAIEAWVFRGVLLTVLILRL
jgi:hypothetical protein